MSKHRKKLLEIYGNKYKEMLGLDNQLWFGKFKGMSIQIIIDTEVTYIAWCLDEKIFILDNKAYLAFQETYKEYQDGLEHGDHKSYGVMPDDIF